MKLRTIPTNELWKLHFASNMTDEGVKSELTMRMRERRGLMAGKPSGYAMHDALPEIGQKTVERGLATGQML